MCDQQRLRPVCAYAQSDQSLCLSIEYSMNVKLLTEHHLEFLSLKGFCTGSTESIHVKIPNCWKSHDTAQISSIIFPYNIPKLREAQMIFISKNYVIAFAFLDF